MHPSRLGWLLALSFVLPACIVPAPSDEKGKPAVVPAEKPRSGVVRLNANLEDKVELLGVQLNPAQVSNVAPMHVLIAFRAMVPLTEDWNVFVHVEDADTGAQLANADHIPSSGPSSRWPVGELRQDQFDVVLPQSASPRAVNLWVGLWNPRTDARMALKNVAQVPNDGRNRLRVGPIPAG